MTVVQTDTWQASCPSDSPIPVNWFLWQWKMSQPADQFGPGFNVASRHHVCTTSLQRPPRCPLGFCVDLECQECSAPFEDLSVFHDKEVVNLALGKSTLQSSTAYGGTSNRAVDGNRDASWGSGTITHTSITNTQGDNWWHVDLADEYPIDRVDIYNRLDCCSDRLSGAKVELLDATTLGVVATDFVDADTTDKALLTLSFGNAVARYVKVSVPGNVYLSMAEVEVYGYAGGN